MSDNFTVCLLLLNAQIQCVDWYLVFTKDFNLILRIVTSRFKSFLLFIVERLNWQTTYTYTRNFYAEASSAHKHTLQKLQNHFRNGRVIKLRRRRLKSSFVLDSLFRRRQLKSKVASIISIQFTWLDKKQNTEYRSQVLWDCNSSAHSRKSLNHIKSRNSRMKYWNIFTSTTS